MKFTGERVVEGGTPERIWLDHLARYEFAGGRVEGKLVLDIACGTGYGSNLLRHRGAKEVVGVDISADAIAFASSKYQQSGLQFNVGDIMNLSLPAEHFDLITCFETIEHVADQEIALRHLRRILKPEGVLIISSPNRRLTSPGKSVHDRPDNPFHAREYSTWEFVAVLKDYFDVLEVYGQRAIAKLLLVPVLEKVMRRIAPALYAPESGSPDVERVSRWKDYRYVIAVCRRLEAVKISITTPERPKN